jgi:hypothetical protein
MTGSLPCGTQCRALPRLCRKRRWVLIDQCAYFSKMTVIENRVQCDRESVIIISIASDAIGKNRQIKEIPPTG